ncbi:DUF2141 domain-containing protein [Neiella marina]|uniref:DUF2141 domain-containing protein n=1 Tax=Neiella holothuriorum TaxID=2870530 RepID=A0ABS7EIS8_9GAMM|nr:DUF2141 domain-containing protein [Neiella holothuriorum]MBW8192149.1 DUF2141 domain-containing protein [Neiella holothuriorum]
MSTYWIAGLITPFMTLIALSAQAATLDVTIDNNQATGGTYIEVYDSNERYEAEQGAIARMILDADDKPLHFVLADLAAGEYVVRMFQDLNGNGQLDANWLGIPNEPYGFSNNVGSYGPASFDDAKVTLIEDQTTEISISLQ